MDIQKIVEQTLLGEALMSAPIAASVFDEERRYVAVNDAFCRLTLYERGELTTIQAGVQLAPDDEARLAIRTAIREHGAAGETKRQAQGRLDHPDRLLGAGDTGCARSLLPPAFLVGRADAVDARARVRVARGKR